MSNLRTEAVKKIFQHFAATRIELATHELEMAVVTTAGRTALNESTVLATTCMVWQGFEPLLMSPSVVTTVV